eukprot:gnl/TRDRNA2_/TRDRNA2_185804_c0_seq1.p2 gnl/TRDRNA2_/TRDRNA2_185804_c0~~gnl/TRDRNA2_/TRDRNA2_185804_c0_seq1.p2  ORF type:complete len:114 (+),score=17.18 gnl/TRDRNA2_/TRDRNA2_185804_c0_seq1:40-381(+)
MVAIRGSAAAVAPDSQGPGLPQWFCWVAGLLGASVFVYCLARLYQRVHRYVEEKSRDDDARRLHAGPPAPTVVVPYIPRNKAPVAPSPETGPEGTPLMQEASWMSRGRRQVEL